MCVCVLSLALFSSYLSSPVSAFVLMVAGGWAQELGEFGGKGSGIGGLILINVSAACMVVSLLLSHLIKQKRKQLEIV